VVYVVATDCALGVVAAVVDAVVDPNAAATRKSTAPVWFCGQDKTARNHPGAKETGTPTVRPPTEIGVIPLVESADATPERSWK
jgi:hypothetical protein